MEKPWFMLLHLWALHRPRKIRAGWNQPRYGETIYDRSLSSVDEQIGKFLEAVPMDDTLVITTGDHGERMNEGDNHWQSHRTACPIRGLEPTMDKWHNRRKKRRMRKMKRAGTWEGAEGGKCHGFHVYEDVIRVPLILTGPGAPVGKEIPDFVRHVDIGPTILDLVGIEKPDDFGTDGRSLVPLLRDETMEPPIAYLEATGTNLYGATNWIACLRTEKLKYCKGLVDQSMPEELYDLVSDPTEQTNLAPDDPRTEEMRKLLKEFAGDLAVNDIVTNLSEDEMAELDETLRALGYLE